jgi:hypothetical protein
MENSFQTHDVICERVLLKSYLSLIVIIIYKK